MELNQLLAARYNKAIRSLLGLEEQEGVTSVSPELQPCVVIDGPAVEHHFLLNERLYHRNFSVAADAANPSTIEIRNPADSGVIVIVDFIEAGANAAADLQVQLNIGIDTDLATAFTALPCDTRPGAVSCSSRLSSANVASATTGALRALAAAGVMHQWYRSFVLAERSALFLTNGVNNATLVGSISFRERPVRPSERVA